jgi:catechol 2,3-dioxygenase-like lactoylglutathione lyase family enzyme
MGQDTGGRIIGLRTAKYRATDLPRARDWYASVLGVKPYFDEPFYVGFNVGGFELGLDPDPASSGEGEGSVTVYWGVDHAETALARLLSLGARSHAPLQDVGDGIRIATVLGLIENPSFAIEDPVHQTPSTAAS